MPGKADSMQSLNDAPNDAQTMPALMEADLPRAPGPSHLPCKGMPGSPTVRLTSQAPHTASARGHAQLSGVALVPHYPPCFHAPRAAPAKHLTLPAAHIVMLGPHVKRKGTGAESQGPYGY